jgi:hypothetical protein
VDPRGLEPLASAMRGRFEGFAAVRHRSEYPLNKRNPGYGLSCMFAVVRAGCRQTVVNLRQDSGPTIPPVNYGRR